MYACWCNIWTNSNVGSYSEEHGEKFHQDIMNFIVDFKAIKYKEKMMSLFLWNLIRESNEYHKS